MDELEHAAVEPTSADVVRDRPDPTIRIPHRPREDRSGKEVEVVLRVPNGRIAGARESEPAKGPSSARALVHAPRQHHHAVDIRQHEYRKMGDRSGEPKTLAVPDSGPRPGRPARIRRNECLPLKPGFRGLPSACEEDPDAA